MQPQDNPYAPPKAQELELSPDSATGRCKHVEWACTLLWIGLGLSTLEWSVTSFTNRHSSTFAADFVGGLIWFGIIIALVVWSIVKLRAGRNWMRWLFTILTVLSFLVIGLVAAALPRELVGQLFGGSTLTAINMGIQMVMSVAEVVLINTPTARQWFHARGNR